MLIPLHGIRLFYVQVGICKDFSPFFVGGEFVLELFQIAILSFLNMHHQAWNSQTLLLF